MAGTQPPVPIPPGARRISIELLRDVQGLTDVQRAFIAEYVWICSNGDIWSTRMDRAPRLHALSRKGVYLRVTLQLGSNKTDRKHLLAHRLVLWAWHGEELMRRVRGMRDRARELQGRADAELTEEENKELLEAEKYSVVDNWQAGHLDNDPTNNRADNIAPQTARENMRQSHARPDRRPSGPAQSRPVVIANVSVDYMLPFRVGHAFDSGAEAARQMTEAAAALGLTDLTFNPGNISNSARGGSPHHGVVFGLGARLDDADEPGEIWSDPAFLDGVPVRMSSTGRIERDGIRTRGYAVPGTRHRVIGIGDRMHLSHRVIWRISNARWNPVTRRLEAAEIPDGQLVLHGGPGRASDAERRDEHGYERNWPVDLRLGTQADNMNDREYERRRREREQSEEGEQPEQKRTKKSE